MGSFGTGWKFPGFLLARAVEAPIGLCKLKNLSFTKIPVDNKLSGIQVSQKTFANRITVSSKKCIFTT
jgi:hypothetical protein